MGAALNTDNSDHEAPHDQLLTVALSVAASGHDVNNLLQIAMGHLELALHDCTPESDDLASCRTALQSAGRLLEQALQASVPQPEHCDVAAVVRGALLLARPIAARVPGLDVSLEVSGAPLATITAGNLQRVVLNLLLNAIAVLPGGGTIVVTVRSDEQAAIIEVRDNGPGLAHPLRLGSIVRRRGGIGLGLPGSELLARRANGALRVADGPAGGTVAVLIIPLFDQSDG